MPKAEITQAVLDIQTYIEDAQDYQLESALQQFNRFRTESATNLTAFLTQSCIRAITIEMHRRVNSSNNKSAI